MVRGLGSQTKLALEIVAAVLTIVAAAVTLGGGLPGGNTIVTETTTTVEPMPSETAANTGTQLESNTRTEEATTTDKSVEKSESTSSPKADAEIASFSPAKGMFENGDVQHAQVAIENTGTARHTFFIGYSVRSPAGEGLHDEGPTEPSVTLAPGETGTVTVKWTVDSDAPAGAYGVIVAVWENREGDNLQNQLDRTEKTTVFEVTNATS